MGTKKKKGSFNSQPEDKKKIETEMANERMNRAGDDDDDDGKHTKNTYLPTHKKRRKERKTQKCIQYANDKSWQQSRILST